MSSAYVLLEKQLSSNPDIAAMAERIQQRRAGRGVRDTAKEVGISPATLSRVENGKIPDLETFCKICAWLGDDPAVFLGLNSVQVSSAPRVQLHFKKGSAIEQDTAKALSEMILLAQQALFADEL